MSQSDKFVLCVWFPFTSAADLRWKYILAALMRNMLKFFLGRIVYQICLEGLDYKMLTSNKETMYTMKLNLVKEMDRVGKGDKGNNGTSSRSTIIEQ